LFDITDQLGLLVSCRLDLADRLLLLASGDRRRGGRILSGLMLLVERSQCGTPLGQDVVLAMSSNLQDRLALLRVPRVCRGQHLDQALVVGIDVRVDRQFLDLLAGLVSCDLGSLLGSVGGIERGLGLLRGGRSRCQGGVGRRELGVE